MYNLLCTQGFPIDPEPRHLFANGFIEVHDSRAATITCGQKDGPLRLRIDTLDLAPGEIGDDWEEVVEVSLMASDGYVEVRDWDGNPIDELRIEFPTGTALRLRAHARGRDLAAARGPVFEGDAEAVEEHLLQFWPGPEADEVVHRASDEVGRQYRDHPKQPQAR